MDYKAEYFDSIRLITIQNDVNKLEYTSFLVNEKNDNMVFFNYNFNRIDKTTIDEY